MEDAIRDLLGKLEDVDASVASLAKRMADSSISDHQSLNEELENELLSEINQYLIGIRVAANVLMNLHEITTKK